MPNPAQDHRRSGVCKTFGELQGEQLKTTPQGYNQDHPNIDLLRYKQFLVSQSYTR